jgi:dTDP-L-rhamnose 4-epimerase
VVLTGAAGFIGGHVWSALERRGHDVVAVDLLLPSAHGDDPVVSDELLRIDVRDGTAMTDALLGADVVCHQAAVVGAGVDVADAPAFASHNDLGTAVLLAAMAAAGCGRLVLASSMVVYGDGRYRCERHGAVEPAPRRRDDLEAGRFDPTCPLDGEPLAWELVDEDAPLRPRSLYATSKVAQEGYALAWTAATGGSAIALRYHNVYGEWMPRDTPYAGVAAMFRSSLERGEAPQVYEDGRQARDFVHVSDVAEADVLAVEAVGDAPSGMTPLNVCSGHPVTIAEVATALSSAGGGPPPLVTGRFRPGDVRHVVADPARAAAVLGFRAAVGPAAGLAAFATAPLRDVVPAGPPRA